MADGLHPGFLPQLLARMPARAHALAQAGAGFHAGPTPRPALPPKPKKPRSQTVSQVANQRVNEQLAPVIASEDAQAKYQNQAIQGFALALLGKLQPVAGQVGSDYDSAIKQTAAFSGATADALRNANPNQQDQQMLASINAPAEQRAQIQNQLANVYGGGAAVGQFLGGEVPGSQLATDKAAAQSQARQLPGIAALKGQQDFASALYSQRQERERTLAQRPGLVQAQTQDIRSNLSAKQAAAYDRYKFDTARADALEAAGQKLEAQRMRDKANLEYKYASLNAENQRTAATIGSENARAAQSQEGQNARTAATIKAENKRAAAAAAARVKAATIKAAGRGAGTDFPNLTKTQVTHLRGGVAHAFYGFTDPNYKDPKTGNVVGKTYAPLPYQEAIDHAVMAGYSRAAATRMANRFYMKGQHGRPRSKAYDVPRPRK